MHIHTRRKKTRRNAFKKKHHIRKTKKGGEKIVRKARQVFEKLTDVLFPSTQGLGKNTSTVYNDRYAESFKPNPDLIYNSNFKKGSVVPMS